MPIYGARSREVLATLHPDLQAIFKAVLAMGVDHSLIEGHRGQAEQHAAFVNGTSKLDWPNSAHNKQPSMAVDAMPYYPTQPHIDWKHAPGIFHFAGVVRATAAMMLARGEVSHRLRWGGDWNSNFDVREKQWDDLPHYELYG